MEKLIGRADAISRFAQSLIQNEMDENGRRSRKAVLSAMFDGDARLLEDNVLFEEMFQAFEDEVAERNIDKTVCFISENVKRLKGKRRFFW